MFEDFEVDNEVGKLYIGKPYMKHKVVIEEEFDSPRITIAFDVINLDNYKELREVWKQYQLISYTYINRIKGLKIPLSKITTKGILDGTIATTDLADNAVNSAKIGADVITDHGPANNSVTVNEIANGAVTQLN